MKYSQEFERDFKWYLSVRYLFCFDGSAEYYNKKGQNIINYDKNGLDAKKSFYLYDSCGKITKTKHPNLLHTLLKTSKFTYKDVCRRQGSWVISKE